ncbi:MAG: hypothetical protein FWD78_10995 [Treponema sp.]|nr:hypothetical protein [Treponema sp.]
MNIKRIFGKSRYAVFFLLLPLLASCVGVNADIVFNSDKSGTIDLEYKISVLLESLGRQDGNENYPVVPAGRTDFERTIARLPGLKLLSYNMREDKNDKTINVKLQFDNPQALMSFLDPAGARAVYSESGGINKLTLVLDDGSRSDDSSRVQNQNPDLKNLILKAAEGYKISVSMSFPTAGKLSILDNNGKPIMDLTAGSNTGMVLDGKKVSFSLPLGTILYSQNGIKPEFTW